MQEVIRELANFENLVYADELYLAGGSAGGTGVLLNVDVVAGMLSETAVKVRGIIDSAWFIDNLPKKADDEECKANGKDCSVIDNLKKGLRLWDAAVPEECGRVFQDEPWKCFLGYQVYKFIKSKEKKNPDVNALFVTFVPFFSSIVRLPMAIRQIPTVCG